MVCVLSLFDFLFLGLLASSMFPRLSCDAFSMCLMKGIAAMEMARQSMKNDYKGLLKMFPKVKKLLNKESSIVFISSISSVMGVPATTAYAAFPI